VAGETFKSFIIGTENNGFGLLGLLRVFSNDYEAEWGQTENVKCNDPKHPDLVYTDLMRIFLNRQTPAGRVRIEMFVLRFEPTYWNFDLRLGRNAQPSLLADAHCRCYALSNDPGYDMRCDYFLSHAVEPGARHPWTQLSLRLEKSGRTDVPAAVRLVVNPSLAQTYQRIRETEIDRNQFSAQLALITGGAVYTVIVPKASAHPHCEQADGEHMFSTIVVFPWAVALLFQRPQCAMTDTTFKSVKPYTLAILHLIFANESIPIAFSVSPSETWLSYTRMYYILLERLVAVSHAFYRGEIAPPLAGVMPEGGYGKWPDDPPQGGDDDLGGAPDECSDESSAADGVADYLSLERRYFPKDTQIWALPEVPDYSPPSRQHVEGSLSTVCRLLLDLPIVTDQGKALEKFVHFFGLEWKLCHRHIIEAIGAKGRMREWVLRILRCYSREQFLRTRMTILMEMHLMGRALHKGDEVVIKILRLLGLRPKDTNPLCDIRHWALWLRPGCPKTTNSAESVNGHLNAEINKGETWIERVKSVANHFMRRYYTRCDWHDRSLKRNLAKCYPDPTQPCCRSQAEIDFYLHLHNAFGKTRAQREAEGFRPADGRLWFLGGSVVQRAESMTFPQGWEVVEEPKKGAAPDEEGTKLVIEKRSANSAFDRMAWDILWSLRNELGKDWAKCGQAVNVAVTTIGRDLRIPDDKVTFAQEALWRDRCWRALAGWRKPQDVNE
jgi:hypothetical protein